MDGNIFEKGENNFFKWIQQKFRINFTATQQDLTNAKIDYKKQLDGNFQQFGVSLFTVDINCEILLDILVIKQELINTKSDFIKQLDGKYFNYSRHIYCSKHF